MERAYFDFVRCADYDPRLCPESCWRAQLTTMDGEPAQDAVYAYAHFAGSPGCIKGGRHE